jgi:hypothetical protein
MMQDSVKVTNDTDLPCADMHVAEEQGVEDGMVVLEGDPL